MKTYFSFLLIGVLLTTACANNAPQDADPIPKQDTFTMLSQEVGEERVMNVWTPESYQTSGDSLIVVYMLDGGIQEDFPHVANTLQELIQAQKIPPVLLVGIENTQRRKDLSGPTSIEQDKEIAPVVGGSKQFRAFVSNELIPEINKRYRTTDKKGILGESLAGLFVTETLLLNPEIFDFYMAFDPSLWWNDQYLVKTANQHLEQFPDSHKTFWFAGSGAEDISANARNLAEILKARDQKNLKWKYADETNETHQTIFRATKEKAIIWTLNNL
ncbi:alpha/beta hydrolase [Sphingobacterium corticibacter]|uniref:Esterase n=1 Tax=Sphingobacterium corticibacter TaxID=2171749 RepID=A0A2T8HFB0_9SPHI|nr:alpha/beta hydrolase-fold protein [Sphingobacterium corticibacter]PVH24093.1 esterase [Sphingobacterium corticibacter]